MPAASQNDFPVTSTWANLITTFPAAANVKVALQNLDPSDCQVVFGGASAPTSKTGLVLSYKDSVEVTTDNIWVRASNPGTVGLHIL